MKRGIFGIGLFLALTMSCGTPRRVTLFSADGAADVRLSVVAGYSTYTMRNGMVVVLAPEEDSNLVTVDVRYFAGALDEPVGKSGVAHLTEHMLFGVVAADGSTLGAQLADSALTSNAHTSYDATHYTSVAIAAHLDKLLAIEAQRMSTSCEQLPSDVFERERAIVIQELAQRADQQRPYLQLVGAIWGPTHRLTAGVGGSDVASLTKADVCDFLRAHYAPNRAALIIGGAIHPKRTLALVAKHFDAVASRELPPPPALAPRKATKAPTQVALSTPEPGVIAAFPLAPVGSTLRVQQQSAIVVASSALAAAASKQRVETTAFAKVVGADRDAVVAFGLFGAERPARELEELIFRTVTDAWKDWNDERLLALKMHTATDLLTTHDAAVGRGSAIADYCQHTEHARYHGEDIDTVMAIGKPTLEATSKALFARERATVLHVSKAPTESGAELALSGSEQEYELPHEPQRAPASPAAALQLPAPRLPQELRMQNGLRVLLVPRPASPMFEARFIFRGGDADDPPGKEGTAELAAMLLNQRTKDVSILDAVTLVNTSYAGSALLASTTASTTMHGVRGPAALASVHLVKLHSTLERGEFNAETLAEIHRRAKEIEAASQKTKPSDSKIKDERQDRALTLAIRKRLFGEGHPSLRRHSPKLSAISADDLQAFRKKHYRMHGAVLIVVGGFDPQEVEGTLFGMFGDWEKGSAPAAPPAPPPLRPAKGPSYFAIDRQKRQLSLTLRFTASSDIGPAAARLVAEKVVQARVATVRERLAATYGINASYEQVGGGSVLVISGAVAPDRGAEVLRAIFETLAIERMDEGGFALQVDRARRKAIQEALARSGSTIALAEMFADAAASELPLDFERAAAAELAKVTTDQVRAVLRADLDQARMVVAAVGPKAAAVLRAGGAATVVTIE